MVAPAMQVCNAILDHLSGGGVIKHIHRLIKRTIKFLRQYCNDPGVLGLNYYAFWLNCRRRESEIRRGKPVNAIKVTASKPV